MKRAIAFFAAVAVAAGFFWVAGFNFDQRGETAAYAYIFLLACGILAASFPGFGD